DEQLPAVVHALVDLGDAPLAQRAGALRKAQRGDLLRGVERLQELLTEQRALEREGQSEDLGTLGLEGAGLEELARAVTILHRELHHGPEVERWQRPMLPRARERHE